MPFWWLLICAFSSRGFWTLAFFNYYISVGVWLQINLPSGTGSREEGPGGEEGRGRGGREGGGGGGSLKCPLF